MLLRGGSIDHECRRSQRPRAFAELGSRHHNIRQDLLKPALAGGLERGIEIEITKTDEATPED